MGESSFQVLSDNELVAHVSALCLKSARVNAEIVRYLVEVEDRRLYLRMACPSMFEFCIRRLHMSEGAAFRRINAARLVRRFPAIWPALASGELHLSGLVLLRDHLREDNVEDILAATRGKSVRQIEELVAAHAPKPDVRARLRPLSPSKVHLDVTLTREQCAKLESARDLMMHRNPTGDLAAVIERALDELLPKLRNERLAETSRPRPAKEGKSGVVSRSARRDVFARDGEQCTFADESGNRCTARGFLEIDHVAARAHGGAGSPDNLQVLCGPHNRFRAEQVFGRKHQERKIAESQRPFDDMLARKLPESQRPSDAVLARKLPESQRPSDAVLALQGLVNLGFKRSESERVLASLPPVPLPDLVRSAILALTS